MWCNVQAVPCAGEPQSPIFSPTKVKYPKHLHPDHVDDKLEQLADTILQRNSYGYEPRGDEMMSAFEMPQYPIEEKENRQYFERQYSYRYGLWNGVCELVTLVCAVWLVIS